MVVYLDIMILENFIVNLFIMFLTSQTLKVNNKILYLLISSFLGSLYILVLIMPSLALFNKLIFKISIAFILILIAFRKRDLIFNIKATAIYIVYSMIIAGICVFLECNKMDSGTSLFIENFSYKKLMISMMIIYIIGSKLIWYIKDRKDISSFIYDVDIILQQDHRRVKAFLDTGNELREPATNLPVLVVEKDVFSNVNLDTYDKFYIPYRVVNGNFGNLEGFKPNYIDVHVGDKKEKKEVIIALSEGKLSGIKDYRALLSRGII
ncbi:TPA: sigma-E processing peptidase SpoIIGA [Clostridium botulinum]|uniref:sigma-E processing peptidase SpoIIGA n=1 Tax=Clostridium TaxID=1485 RepID=UPI0007743514|nr:MULTISPECIES: sigma-E processing peptidase SpoIIGA [Clostridium]AUM96305.1 sigma-E processing peptidase SpoIIGA [Clostridium sporogenes]AVQ53760.1 sigma-E processing peptidase SpoIIGA [Clostridium botulinum]HBJ2614877.1 sigma-E processing peptidase SpoIIGA [Clostridium botulinum]